MDIDKLFNNVEKIFRYLIPAFVFTLLLKYFEPGIYCNYVRPFKGIQFVIYFVLAGMTIYSIHRLLFELVDLQILNKNDKSELEHNLDLLEIEDNKLDHFYYKMATIHSVLIATELIAIFTLYNILRDFNYILLFSLMLPCIMLFCFALYFYRRYNKLQIQIVEILAKEIKSKKSTRRGNRRQVYF